MKTGILTLHSNTNFGGGLQQIAMFETLKALGHEPRFLCVRNNSKVSPFKRILGICTSYSPQQLANATKEACVRVFAKKRPETPNILISQKTDNFNYSRLNYTPKFNLNELPAYAEECDALIFGSDQIWTDVYSPILPYFGDGMSDFKGKKIAFAACSAHSHVPSYNRNKIRNLLSGFHAISVRDNTTKKLVEKYSEAKPPIVCDPTLLYDFKPYFKPSPLSGDYIFAYVLGDKDAEWHQRNIAKIKSITGITNVVALTTSLKDNFPWADITITDAISVDWMNILREAGFVYTNSFHAVLFSLKFHREFVAYYGDLVRSSRMSNLRSQFGLNNRIVKNLDDVDFTQPIDFSAKDTIIKEMADSSMSFLQKALDCHQS